MSSKIVSGKQAAGASSMEWKSFQAPGASPPPPPPPEPPAQQLEPLMVRIRELETLVEVRAREAYQRGSHDAEQQSAARLDSTIKRFAESTRELTAMAPRARRDAEEDIVRLAIAIARKLLQREIAVDPDSLLGLVKAAIQRIDAREIQRIRVNPEDARVIEQALNAPGSHRRIEISPDSSLERGAAILETSRGNLDASVDTQLKEIERGFLDLVRTRR